AVGAEAQGAKLTAESKYSMIGMLREDLKKVLEADINSQLQGLPNQKIYDSGINKVSFGNFETKEGGVYVALASTTGYVGPNIDSAQLAKQLSGKRSGEVQSQVQTIDGVESVDVKLSPFWVNKAPSEDKITIKFLIKNEAN
ncbi:hypothetical protein H7Y40_00655, partial [Pedobacter sp.]|nr:hypothetical protein [Candidatus Saccharibacteria bacterium]